MKKRPILISLTTLFRKASQPTYFELASKEANKNCQNNTYARYFYASNSLQPVVIDGVCTTIRRPLTFIASPRPHQASGCSLFLLPCDEDNKQFPTCPTGTAAKNTSTTLFPVIPLKSQRGYCRLTSLSSDIMLSLLCTVMNYQVSRGGGSVRGMCKCYSFQLSSCRLL